MLNIKGFDPNELVVATVLFEGQTEEDITRQEQKLYPLAERVRWLPWLSVLVVVAVGCQCWWWLPLVVSGVVGCHWLSVVLLVCCFCDWQWFVLVRIAMRWLWSSVCVRFHFRLPMIANAAVFVVGSFFLFVIVW